MKPDASCCVPGMFEVARVRRGVVRPAVSRFNHLVSDHSGTWRRCDACGQGALRPFADLGEIPARCGVHWPDPASARASPVGRMLLGYCPQCCYLRNLAFDPTLTGADPTMAVRTHRSPAYQVGERPVVNVGGIELLVDPYQFLVDLRDRAGGEPTFGHVEVPAYQDLASAGWEATYPQVSYFDVYSLCRLMERAGWRVDDAGTMFPGTSRFVEISANQADGTRRAGTVLPGTEDRDRQLAMIVGFAARHHEQRAFWRQRIARLARDGARPVLWGAGRRAVRFLASTDQDHRLAGVVDPDPNTWGRFLPITAHRIDPPESLATVAPAAVVVTDPGDRAAVTAALVELGLTAEVLVA